jgi:hypothetical protein
MPTNSKYVWLQRYKPTEDEIKEFVESGEVPWMSPEETEDPDPEIFEDSVEPT